MKVLGVQLDIAWEDPEANFSTVRALLAAARPPAGALVVLPEMFSSGFSMDVDRAAGGGAEGFVEGLARELGVTVVAGVVSRSKDGRGLNQAFVAAPSGPLARYSKIHPFSFAGETRHYASGKEVAVFRWGEVAVCPFVCYDLRFPEVFREGVRKGAQLYAVIANWPEAREAHWLALLKARAIENQAFVVGVNRCGRDPKLAYSGRGQVIDPRGNVLADGGNAEGVFGADVDLAALLRYRSEFPALSDMKG